MRPDEAVVRPRRRLLRAAGALLVLIVLGLVGAQVFISWWVTERLPGILNRDTRRLAVTWSELHHDFLRGLRVRDLRLVGQTHRVQWELVVDEARTDIGMLALQRKRLHFDDMLATGVSLRIRRFGDDPAAAPPIEGLAPPLAENAPPARVHAKKRWTYEFDDCDARDIREIWIASWRASDLASVHVDHVASRVKELLEIDGAVVETGGAALSRHDVRIADEIAFEVELALKGYDRASAPPREMLDHATGHVRGSAKLVQLELENAHFPNLPWIGFDGARGTLDVDAGIHDGTLDHGGSFTLAAEDLTVAALGYRVTSAAKVAGQVTPIAGGTGTIHATLSGFRVFHAGSQAPLAEGEGLIGTIGTKSLRLRDLFRDYDVDLDLPAARVLDVGELDPLIPDTVPVSLRGGSGTVLAHLHATDTASSGTARIDLAGLDIVAGDATLRGGLVVDATLPSVDPNGMRFDLTGSKLLLRDIVVQGAAREGEPGWNGELEVARGVLVAKDAPSFDGELRARLDDMRPVLALVDATRGLPPMAGTLLQGKNVDAHALLVTRPDALDLRDAVLEAEGLEAGACLQLRGAERRGWFWFDSGMIAAGVRFTPDGRHLKLMAGRAWLEERRADCD